MQLKSVVMLVMTGLAVVATVAVAATVARKEGLMGPGAAHLVQAAVPATD